jgi:Fe-S cluster assembly protein SufD
MKTLQQYLQSNQNALTSQVYDSLPIITKKLEEWKFFDNQQWFEKEWNFDLQPAITDNYLNDLLSNVSYDSLIVIDNGTFDTKKSKIQENSTSIISIDNAIKNNELQQIKSNKYTSKFDVLHFATSSNGYEIKISKDIHLVIVNAVSGNDTFSVVSNSIVCENGVKVIVTEFIVSYSDNQSIISNKTSIICEENSICEYSVIQKLHSQVSNIQTVNISQKSNTTSTVNSFPISGKYIRSSISVEKLGEHAQTNLYGLFFPTNDEHFEIYTRVFHYKPECETKELFKGLADKNGQGVFSGLIYVERGAQKTLAVQSNRNMLLSETAKIHSKPQLEIYADDVSCNHGSTTGQVNREALWYMQARGIAPKEALQLLLEGFIQEVVEKVSLDEIKFVILDCLKNKI